MKKLESLVLTRVKKLQVINDDMRSLKVEVLAYRKSSMKHRRRDDHEVRLQEMTALMNEKEKVIQGQDVAIERSSKSI